MPGIVTHYLFGTDVHASLAEVIDGSPAALDAFLLGNQGPDPFFYLAATPQPRALRYVGQTMHRQKTPELLAAMHEHLVKGSDRSKRERNANSGVAMGEAVPSGPCKAYALGFLCHHLLDSTVHPLVYAQERALCDVGIEGLSGEWAHRVVHATIETEIDEYVLTTRVGATAAMLPPHKTALRCPASVLEEISREYAKVFRDAYGLDAPEAAFSTAVSIYRIAQRALDSRSNGLRQRFDYLGWAGMPSAYAQALSLRPEPRSCTPFANDDHTPWDNPSAGGEPVSESFDELYARALARAIEALPAYADPSFGLEGCKRLVNNVNFLGQ